ncbi:MAG: glycoside hydrolase family 3 protein, partial [Bacteroidota bacterium]
MKTIRIFILIFIFSPVLQAQTYLDPDAPVEERVDDLLSRMTLEEKVGQMVQAERGNISGELQHIDEYHIGSVLSGGGSVPSPNTPASWVEMYNNMQSRAMSTRLGIPLIYGIDAVHGHNNLKDAVIFPHNIGLGCTRNPELVRQCAEITATEVRATGIDWTFSPCITVPQNELWGRTYEGFGELTSLVDTLGRASVLGYQSDSLGSEESILACIKHFVGDGGTENGIDQGNTVISEEELHDIHLEPYISSIEAGAGSVMASFSSWNGEKCHGHEYLLTDVLKEELQFEGFLLSDWLGIDQLNGDFKAAVTTAVNAGIDMAMQPDNYIQFVDVLKQSVNDGSVSMQRIDDAVSRILRIKFRMGLFENPYAENNMADTVGCDAHREIARQAVRESLVLLKNDNILPFQKEADDILVAGSKANDVGIQCGGWSIWWQGGTGNITEGTTIYEAVRQMNGSENTMFTTNSSNIPDADFAIVAVGESPYAEGAGDLYHAGASGFALSQDDKNLVQAVEESGIPFVIVLISGRPLDIRDELELSDAFVAAWLPGTEGGSGIADVLFGDYEPTGKLSHTWPASYNDVPVNNNSYYPDDAALFDYGFGLNYESVGLPE